MINIIQHGIDGFGHQLHGLFTCLIFQNIKNYNFDGHMFLRKKFYFDHIKQLKEFMDCKQYLIEIVRLFIIEYKIVPKKYKKHIHSHEIYHIPNNYDNNTIYSLDNIFYFDKANINKDENIQLYKNIETIKPLFINKFLPENRLKENNIVFHFRLGDAMTTGRANSINNYNKLVILLIEILSIKYPNYTYYLHSDGNISYVEYKLKEKNIEYILFNKTTPLLNVLSDFIYSKILISGNSSLSKVSSFLGEKEFIITNDDNDVNMPNNTYRISDYLKQNNNLLPKIS